MKNKAKTETPAKKTISLPNIFGVKGRPQLRAASAAAEATEPEATAEIQPKAQTADDLRTYSLRQIKAAIEASFNDMGDDLGFTKGEMKAMALGVVHELTCDEE